jgi:hypothetical protein
MAQARFPEPNGNLSPTDSDHPPQMAVLVILQAQPAGDHAESRAPDTHTWPLLRRPQATVAASLASEGDHLLGIPMSENSEKIGAIAMGHGAGTTKPVCELCAQAICVNHPSGTRAITVGSGRDERGRLQLQCGRIGSPNLPMVCTGARNACRPLHRPTGESSQARNEQRPTVPSEQGDGISCGTPGSGDASCRFMP